MQDVVETVEIGAHHHIPIILAQRRKSTVTRQPGVEHHAVIGAVGFDVGFENGFAGGAVGDVELEDARFASQGFDFGLYCRGLGQAAAAMQHDVMPGLGQTQGDGAADATAGTGDQYGFSHGWAPCEELRGS
ncbi:hypothetical protein D3C71_642510 [compost metagenome]